MWTSFDGTIHRGARLLVVALALGAAGCQYNQVTSNTYPVDYRDRHPIQIAERDHSVDVFVGIGRGGLTAAQRAQVAAFGGAWRREGNGALVVHVPQGTPNERAAQATVREVTSVLHSVGVPATAVKVVRYRPRSPIEIGPIRLSMPVMRAEVGPCGQWPYDLGSTADPLAWDNLPYWNHGCATQRNLAAMIADPADLVQPRAETSPVASRRQTVMEKYRQGQDPSTVYTKPTEAKASQVGQ
jgi:pilus assembly protein CpaD